MAINGCVVRIFRCRSKVAKKAERIYGLLAEGEVFMKMKTFFAHPFGRLRDKFGTNWMVNHDKPMPMGA